MNKKELIEKIETMPNNTGFIRPKVDKHLVLGLVRELDEPQKVKVSEEEEEFLKTFDFNCESDVAKALYCVSRTGWGYFLKDNNDIEFEGLSEGFRELENRKRLIKAILDGYEVEKEKRYLVKMKGVENCSSYLKLNKKSNRWYFGENFSSVIAKELKISHTRKELEEAGFGWVFDCEGIEIEEIIE